MAYFALTQERGRKKRRDRDTRRYASVQSGTPRSLHAPNTVGEIRERVDNREYERLPHRVVDYIFIARPHVGREFHVTPRQIGKSGLRASPILLELSHARVAR